ncbi:MAG TPA: hypothetical protein VH110_00180 [Candidatus Acidoferrum sp.]|jgi:hypothetical protein|nr:hypothetical protein [Candidatus Acidoferrum sp.]
MTKKTRKLSVYLSLVVMPVGLATVGLATRANRPSQLNSTDSSLEINAAYRDGVYLGKLDGQEGRKVRPSVGRWNAEVDRASFTTGYEKGYREALAQRIAEHRY